MPNWPFNATRIEVLGTKGFMYFGRHGDGWQVFNEKAESVVAVPGRQADKEHQDNFLDCVRSRQLPICDVAIGASSAIACHVMNFAYHYGANARWNPVRNRFADGGSSKWLTRDRYRAGWRV